MVKTFKVILIGFVATICRIGFQLLMPASTTQSVLKPSIFVMNGTLPLAFSILALIAYSTIAFIFLIVLGDGRVRAQKNRGIKFVLPMCFLWSAYLLEPLPHAISIWRDSIAYILADCTALLIVGILLDVLFKNDSEIKDVKYLSTSYPLKSMLLPIVFFIIGRLIMYKIFGIYSYFDLQPVKTLIWGLFTGITSSFVVISLFNQIKYFQQVKRPLFSAITTYAINLIFFNGFMLLVFNFSIFDLSMRTITDILTISIGLLIGHFFRSIKIPNLFK